MGSTDYYDSICYMGLIISSAVWIDSKGSVHCLLLWVNWFGVLYTGFPFEMLPSGFFFPFFEGPARIGINIVSRELDN